MAGESVCVNPQKIPDVAMAADLLSQVLAMDRAKLLWKDSKRLRFAAAGSCGSNARSLSEEAERLRSLKLDWVEFRAGDAATFYPHQYAGGACGRVGGNDRTPMTWSSYVDGTAGIEASFDEELAGAARDCSRACSTDVKQNPYDEVETR